MHVDDTIESDLRYNLALWLHYADPSGVWFYPSGEMVPAVEAMSLDEPLAHVLEMRREGQAPA